MESSITGVEFRRLATHGDERGDLTELFRAEWFDGVLPLQWNVLRSSPDTLRGVHCHVVHSDVLAVVEGELILGLVDLRESSSTYLTCELHRLEPLSVAVTIPAGVGHGFCFEVPTVAVYGVTSYWNVEDELGCRWDDPGLAIGFPCTDPVLSERDRSAGTLGQLIADVRAGLEARGS